MSLENFHLREQIVALVHHHPLRCTSSTSPIPAAIARQDHVADTHRDDLQGEHSRLLHEGMFTLPVAQVGVERAPPRSGGRHPWF